MMAQILGDPFSRVPALGASGAIAAVMGAFLITFPRDRIRTFVFFLIFFRITLIPAALLIGFWFLMQVLNVGVVAQVKNRRSRLPRSHWRLPLWRHHRKIIRKSTPHDLSPL